MARTDALAAVGLDEAISRVTAAREAGADASFVEAPRSVEQLAEMGFHLIVYPLSGIFAAARALEAIYRKVLTDRTTLGEESRLMSFAEFNTLIGVAEKHALAERFGAES